jgi:succinyl-CoA synthetase beta subunit
VKLYEYEAKGLFRTAGIPVPAGTVCRSETEAFAAAAKLGYPLVVKAQVLQGGRGKAGAIRFADGPEALHGQLSDLFHLSVRTETVRALLLEQRIAEPRELYAGITLDPRTQRPLLMFSPEGGVDIERLAQTRPDRLFTLPLDPLSLPAATSLAAWLHPADLPAGTSSAVAAVLAGLITAYFRFEAVTAEINPLLIDRAGRPWAADGKMDLDDSALERIPEARTFARPPEILTPLEEEARREGIAYVSLAGGAIGLISGGAGLGMASMDMIARHGGRPANFLDLGGNATAARTAAALRIVLKTPGVEGILINVFGGINNCEQMALGIADVMDAPHPDSALVVKMRGHSQDEGWAILAARGIPVVRYGTTEEAVVVLMDRLGRKGGDLGHPG